MAEHASAELYWRKPFIITENKLSRIVEVARDRLERVDCESSVTQSFTVTIKGNKTIRLTSASDVIKLDNSKLRPIVALEIELLIRDGDDVAHCISIDFNGSFDETGFVRLYAHSVQPAWVQETMGALEEQVERVFQSGLTHFLAGNTNYILPFLAMAAVLVSSFSYGLKNASKTFFGLDSSDKVIAELISLGQNATTDPEKVNFIYKVLMRALENTHSRFDYFHFFFEARTYLVGVPVIITVLCALIAILTCYPKIVFAWGDWAEIYERIVERRKFLWYGVIGSVVAGILGNIFVMGITTFR